MRENDKQKNFLYDGVNKGETLKSKEAEVMDFLKKILRLGKKKTDSFVHVMPARCVKTREPFDIIVEKKNDRLVMVRGEKPKFTAASGLFKASGLKTVNITGGLYNAKSYRCPDCGNSGIVRCGKCNNITCYDRSGHFKCAYCTNKGEVNGVIKTVSVYNGTKNDGMKPSGDKGVKL